MLPERPLLVLCDLEGVLLDIPGDSRRHKQAYEHAIRQVTGLDAVIDDDRRGHTDYTLVAKALSEVGLDEIISQEDYDAICQVALEQYLLTCPEKLDMFLRPGVWSTLTQLQLQTPGVTLAPCSGYAHSLARVIMERSYLNDPFRVLYSAFAGYGHTRPDLIELARRQAGGSVLPWPIEQTVLVSRCSLDLTAGHSVGVRTVAVDCPGANAHTHIDDFAQLPEVLDKLHLR